MITTTKQKLKRIRRKRGEGGAPAEEESAEATEEDKQSLLPKKRARDEERSQNLLIAFADNQIMLTNKEHIRSLFQQRLQKKRKLKKEAIEKQVFKTKR
mmetsp:Transcript_24181/g.37192  ORF Transcript_24181/g.37192 Transcript_24181/m.37192 type:complete len:99 (+) Transcript_24181:1558-1854(+)